MKKTPARKMVSFMLDAQLIKRLSDWITAQQLPPSKTVVFEVALREFLDKNDKRNS